MVSENQTQPDEKERVAESERWKIWLEAARLSMKKGKFKEAEAGYRLVIELNPKSTEALTELCTLLLQQRRETDAEIVGKMLLKLTGGKGFSWARLRGQLREKHLDKEIIAKAEFDQKEQVKIQKDDQIDKHDATVSYPSRESHTVLEKQPFPEWKRVKKPKQMSEKRGQITPTTQTQQLVDTKPAEGKTQPTSPIRQKQRSTGEFKDLASQRQLQEEPDHEGKTSEQWISFAQLYSKHGKYADAERAARSAIRMDQSSKSGKKLLGQILYKREKFEEAAEVLTEVVGWEPKNAHLHYLLGMCHMQLKNFWEASQAFYKSVALNDAYIDAWSELGVALAKLGRNSQAQKAFLRALKERRNDARLLAYYGASLAEEGRLDRAENVFRMAIAANPDFAPAWEQLSRILTRLGKHEHAQQAMQRARSIASHTKTSLVLE